MTPATVLRKALETARAIIQEDRDELFSSCTVSDNPATLGPEDAAFVEQYDDALAAIDAALGAALAAPAEAGDEEWKAKRKAIELYGKCKQHETTIREMDALLSFRADQISALEAKLATPAPGGGAGDLERACAAFWDRTHQQPGTQWADSSTHSAGPSAGERERVRLGMAAAARYFRAHPGGAQAGGKICMCCPAGFGNDCDGSCATPPGAAAEVKP